MIMSNDAGNELPREAMEDCFHPPAEPVEVECIHCGREYRSDAIVWKVSAYDGKGHWCCPFEDCTGQGYGFDILPVESNVDGQGEFDLDDPCLDCQKRHCEKCEYADGMIDLSHLRGDDLDLTDSFSSLVDSGEFDF
jgi:hypothetical protein